MRIEAEAETRRLCGFGLLWNFVGLRGLVLEEAENGVALAKDSRLQQTAEALGELEGAAVLSDYDAAEAEKGSVAQKAEDTIVLLFFGVGRIDESEIEGRIGGLVASGEFFEGAEGVKREDLAPDEASGAT